MRRACILLVVVALVVPASGTAFAAPENMTTTTASDDESLVSAPTNVSIDFSGLFDSLGTDDDEPLDKGVIRYEETEGEGYSSIYDWGSTRFADVQFEPDSDTAVFVFYLPEGEDTVAITEGVESGEARQTRADLDQGPGLYWVRADVVHNDGLLGGEQCGSIATQEGSHNLYKSCEGTGMGPIIPDAPAPISLLIGSLSVAAGTLAVATVWGGRRSRRVKHR